ncbi:MULTISPECIES: F0F1 ATP synthase subunit B [Ignavibacterium]|jgi:F-type H+-transporting ATPase subunit b|uniref:F0F1 ATP synthase subunit B n=1 Tax=Ignavibacterium TaxID=795750 RepID=UPI0025BCCB19|nr:MULTISPECIES: F0F1 ATP synthase subunit B [Ignavibacterium]MBI5663441.1 F0F1 ATP synthase subunit B [Ignavibacterium album]
MIAKIYFAVISIIASEGGGSGLLSVDGGLAFWTTLTFLILLFILGKFAWKPILTALKQREEAIKESLAQAELAKEEAKKILAENQASLAKAEEESKKIIEQSRAYAENLKQQIINESKAQAQKLIDDASAEIERKKLAAFDELKNQVAQIAVDAASKILKENLDAEKNKQLVEKYIKEISKN